MTTVLLIRVTLVLVDRPCVRSKYVAVSMTLETYELQPISSFTSEASDGTALDMGGSSTRKRKVILPLSVFCLIAFSVHKIDQ